MKIKLMIICLIITQIGFSPALQSVLLINIFLVNAAQMSPTLRNFLNPCSTLCSFKKNYSKVRDFYVATNLNRF